MTFFMVVQASNFRDTLVPTLSCAIRVMRVGSDERKKEPDYSFSGGEGYHVKLHPGEISIPFLVTLPLHSDTS